jgi:predicted acyltransferase
MILVNSPGSWSHVYAPLRHAQWHGFTPTDLVFPFFLFIVGTAMAFSFARFVDGERPRACAYPRILRRTAVLFALGLLINGFPSFELADLRIMGVLQRIAIAYLLASIAVLHLSRRGLWVACGSILLGYWAAMQWVPVPGFGAGDLSPEGNLAAHLDRLTLTSRHLYRGGSFDPEGLVSTLPSVVTVLLGYFAGQWLRSRPVGTSTSLMLGVSGLVCVLAGAVWALAFPINKQLWTSSYVIFTAGWAQLLLALFFEAVEVRGWKNLSSPFEIVGLNAITIYVASVLVAKALARIPVGTEEGAGSAQAWIHKNLFESWAGPIDGSLLHACATVVLWWLVAYALHRRGWAIKV